MKVKPEVHAESMRRAMGVEKAIKVAQHCANVVKQESWSNIPRTAIYYTKDRRGNEKLDERHLKRLEGFWTTVVGVLNKKR